jgi:hypothetical protein
VVASDHRRDRVGCDGASRVAVVIEQVFVERMFGVYLPSMSGVTRVTLTNA